MVAASAVGRVTARHAPDYVAIACMEQEVYGTTFEHWGGLTSACVNCPDCGGSIGGSLAEVTKALAAHADPGSKCHWRYEKRVNGEPFTNWDQWCVCGRKFTGTAAKNRHALSAHWASGMCPHPTIGSVPIMVADEPAIESAPFTAAIGDALAADGLISYRQVAPIAPTPARASSGRPSAPAA